MFAPYFEVTFEDNMFGDVLTSLVKPLIMVPRAVCYILSDHPQTHASVAKFELDGHLCPSWERNLLEPIVAALPIVFRAFQCLRRFRDTRQRKHLWNFGKYIASLSVVVFASFLSKKGFLVVTVSVIATIYAATWDIALDWGLSLDELRPRLFGTAEALPSRNFSQHTYLLATFFDILARCTWVQTLMPAGMLTSNVVIREAITTSTAAVEIIRRSIWAVLRIEYEQVSNASQFRTLLWVPSKLNRRYSEVFHGDLSRSSSINVVQASTSRRTQSKQSLRSCAESHHCESHAIDEGIEVSENSHRLALLAAPNANTNQQ
jgi:hypothetical protein